MTESRRLSVPTALTLLSRAERCLQNDHPSAALRLLREAAARSAAPPRHFRLARSGGDLFLRAEIEWRLAETLRVLGRFPSALALYWSSHALYRRCGVSSERLRTLLGASACLRILGRYAQAGRMWRNAERRKFFRAKDPSPGEILLERALVERGSGHLSSAGRMLKKCLGLFHRSSDVEALRHAWWALGGVERFSGRFRFALRAFEKAERLAARLKDSSSRAYALCGQAGALRVIGRGSESLRKYRHARAIFERIGDPFGQAYGLCGMGNALRVWGDAQKSLPLYRRSCVLYERAGDEGSYAFALWGLGGSYRRLGRWALAGSFYRRALDLFVRVKDFRGQIMAHLGLGRVLDRNGGLSAAPAHVRKAVDLSVRHRLPYETALSRFEEARLLQRPAPRNLFGSLGIPPAAVKRWKDIP